MMTFVTEVNGHRIEVSASRWSGYEQVTYDDFVVSKRRNLQTLVGVHVFEREENGERVVYEVNVIGGMLGGVGFVLRRNGIAVGSAP